MEKEYISIPNPNFVFRKEVEEQIKNNDGYCLMTVEHSEDTKCPCKDFKEQNYTGLCKCGQYYKILHAPKVCLCGSTRFKDTFFKIAKEFTLNGYIVTMPLVFHHSGDKEITEEEKKNLDELHKAKIADADLIYIINCDNYIGNSTRSEIKWAVALGKKIEYLENNELT